MKKIIGLCLLCFVFIILLTSCVSEDKKVEENITTNVEESIEDKDDLELKIARIELKLLELEKELSLLEIEKRSYEEAISHIKSIKPNSYENETSYRENNAKLVLIEKEIKTMKASISEIENEKNILNSNDLENYSGYKIVGNIEDEEVKKRLEELNDIEQSGTISIQEERVNINNEIVGNLTPMIDIYSLLDYTYFEDYDNKIVTGTQVKGAFQNFMGKPVAFLVHTNKMVSSDIENSIVINGIVYVNYNAILNDNVISDLSDNIVSNNEIFVSNYTSCLNTNMSGMNNSRSIEYVDSKTLFLGSVVKSLSGKCCGVIFVEK